MGQTLQIGGITITDAAPVLIAGATASGKSGLALRIADTLGGTIVNADALQVYDGWRILTARPDDNDLATAPHALYGHVSHDSAYSVGNWLTDIARLADHSDSPLIIVGGTGLYFRALTEGLADIPPVPADIQDRANSMTPDALIAGLDPATRARIDLQNPRRLARAWAVQTATGRGLAAWQDATPPPLMPLGACQPILLDADRDWLNARIATRFDQMIANGALDEARAMHPGWESHLPSSQAIGASALIAHLENRLTLAQASTDAVTATRQYAKRQRTWFRARMKDWHNIDPATL